MNTETPTMYELLADMRVTVSKTEHMRHSVAKTRPPLVVEGVRPVRVVPGEGLHTLTVEQLLAVKVDPVRVNGRVIGYQRPLDETQVRAIAVAMHRGVVIPRPSLAQDGHGTLWAVDGQHRLAGAIVAGLPLKVVVELMSKDEQRSGFLAQRFARRIAPDVTTMAGTDPIARYVQEACVRNDNAWSDIVSMNKASKTMITPYAAYRLLLRYVYNVEGQAASYKHSTMDDHWDKGLADELAPLISCFGNKQSNPAAFKPATVQAIGAAALWVFRRNVPFVTDRERWMEHMSAFQFKDYLHVTTQMAKTDLLLDHWNKRLSKPRKVWRSR